MNMTNLKFENNHKMGGHNILPFSWTHRAEKSEADMVFRPKHAYISSLKIFKSIFWNLYLTVNYMKYEDKSIC